MSSNPGSVEYMSHAHIEPMRYLWSHRLGFSGYIWLDTKKYIKKYIYMLRERERERERECERERERENINVLNGYN